MLSRSASVVLYQSHAPRLFLLQLGSRLCMVSHNFQPRLRMNYTLIPKELRPIAEKIEAASRISESDALILYRSNDLNALGMLANVVRERRNGNFATYIHNRYINYSNICVLSCQFCAFAAKKRDAHAFEYASDEIINAVREALPLGITEVHMVGGLHPPPNGWMCTACGIRWAAAAPALCSTVTSKRLLIVWITCGSFASYKMGRAGSLALFHL